MTWSLLTLATYDTDTLRVEAREYEDGRITVWWTDGPRTAEDDYPSREEAIREVQLAYVDELAEYMPGENVARWLLTPHRLLDGETPAALLLDSDTEKVPALVEQLRTGAYV